MFSPACFRPVKQRAIFRSPTSDTIPFPGNKDITKDTEACPVSEPKTWDDCKLVDADIDPIPGISEGNITVIDKRITCWYQCPDMSIRVGQDHFIPNEMAALITNKAQALAWCPKKM